MTGTGGMLAAAVLKAAAGKVAAAAGDRIILQWRFRKDLEYMRETLESIEAVLEDAERRSIEDKSVQLWLERLTRASYDISDMFDKFDLNKTRKSTSRNFKVLNSCLTLPSEVCMASKMKKVREKLEKIKSDREAFSFSTSNNSHLQQVVDNRATASKVIEADILGRDGEKQKLIELLVEASTSSDFIVLPIYGIGGIGKTTLAQLLFNDTHFKNYEKAWVYVSQTFDKKKIEDDITLQLEKERSKLTDIQETDAANKKILIVLDDLWESGDFELDDLKRSLKMVGNGHKVHVIVTTRDASIAQKIHTIEAHKIDALSLDVCWIIIKQIVDFEKRTDKEMLEVTGREIAEKCRGVALAARALGYILRFKDSVGWVSVKDSGIWSLSTSGYKTFPYDNVLASLKLSYISMPPYLRQCFGYCAIFPKGHNMAKDDLIYQWSALGFITQSEEVSIWQLGEIRIKQLLEMSFFQHSKSPTLHKQHDEDVTLLTMHDLVHDLARSITGHEVLDASEKFNTGGRNCRYAFLVDYSKPLDSFMTYPNKIRALHILGSGEIGHCSVGFATAKYLRVLDLRDCSLKKLPSSIGQLKLLRYLSLRGSSKLLALPESIGGMEGLMYLNLSGCKEIKMLPESFGKLESLVYLDLSNCYNIEMLPKSFGKLESLVHLNLSYCIQNFSSFQGLHEVIGELTELRYLNLSSCLIVPSEGIEEYYFHCIRDPDENSEVTNSLLDKISTLSNLEHLVLSSHRFVTLPDSFCSLKKLHTLDLTRCKYLKELPGNMGHMGSLKFLIVNKCGNLDMSTLPINKSLIPLPFLVHTAGGEQSSNLILLKDANLSTLEISRLENVKCIKEARRIELKEKRSLVSLALDWTGQIKGFVEDMELLRELMPPSSLESFELRGYKSVSFPAWLMDIATYLPNLVRVTLKGLAQCSSLLPLGQLPNIHYLILQDLPSITKIDRYFCGEGMKAFTRLEHLTISDMKNLEEWSTTYSCGEGVAEEFMFPNLRYLTVFKCDKLRVKPCPPRVKDNWRIQESDGVLLQWEEGVPDTVCSTSPALVHALEIRYCLKPMHQWKLLCRLRLTELVLVHCNDVSSSQEITQVLTSLQSLYLAGRKKLPHWLGGLTSLKRLSIPYCDDIMSFPERIKLLTNLEILDVTGCPELRKWCELEENKTKIDHIKKIFFS